MTSRWTRGNRTPVVVATLFLGLLAVNLVILAFDFPRTTSLTLFFFAVAVVMGLVLLFTFRPSCCRWSRHALAAFRPWPTRRSTGQWPASWGQSWRRSWWWCVSTTGKFGPTNSSITTASSSNLERLAAPNLRIDKEINDIFEYLLLRSGRLILQASNERRAIILDNVPWITQKEEAITRMLGRLQVQVRPEGEG